MYLNQKIYTMLKCDDERQHANIHRGVVCTQGFKLHCSGTIVENTFNKDNSICAPTQYDLNNIVASEQTF